MNLSYGRVNNKELILKIPGIHRWNILRQDTAQRNAGQQRKTTKKNKSN